MKRWILSHQFNFSFYFYSLFISFRLCLFFFFNMSYPHPRWLDQMRNMSPLRLQLAPSATLLENPPLFRAVDTRDASNHIASTFATYSTIVSPFLSSISPQSSPLAPYPVPRWSFWNTPLRNVMAPRQAHTLLTYN